jgi:hypothetical protein
MGAKMPTVEAALPPLTPATSESSPRTSDNNMFKFAPFIPPTAEEEREMKKALVLS